MGLRKTLAAVVLVVCAGAGAAQAQETGGGDPLLNTIRTTGQKAKANAANGVRTAQKVAVAPSADRIPDPSRSAVGQGVVAREGAAGSAPRVFVPGKTPPNCADPRVARRYRDQCPLR